MVWIYLSFNKKTLIFIFVCRYPVDSGLIAITASNKLHMIQTNSSMIFASSTIDSSSSQITSMDWNTLDCLTIAGLFDSIPVFQFNFLLFNPSIQLVQLNHKSVCLIFALWAICPQSPSIMICFHHWKTADRSHASNGHHWIKLAYWLPIKVDNCFCMTRDIWNLHCQRLTIVIYVNIQSDILILPQIDNIWSQHIAPVVQ